MESVRVKPIQPGDVLAKPISLSYRRVVEAVLLLDRYMSTWLQYIMDVFKSLNKSNEMSFALKSYGDGPSLT